ncbi:MAG: hypothetical protein RMK91_07795 [Pseudanabaenaceae cyanobacterium SKYGB_i_bin29]|nr:hypothetical protein [Pseudanabaenaceae cyanobacterium SKYG29]MDW8421755.1 hypothetical protein [Pseudanabaenaceae cyanobacterium SKYGB_i_bin29]
MVREAKLKGTSQQHQALDEAILTAQRVFGKPKNQFLAISYRRNSNIVIIDVDLTQ